MDKYFADDLLAHKENEIIAGDIISMMHKLGHTVVAEGVEREEQKNIWSGMIVIIYKVTFSANQ